MQNRLAVFKTGVSEDRRLFMDLIERLWEKAATMASDSPLESGGREWGVLAEASTTALAALVPMGLPEEDDSGEAWWEMEAAAGFRVVVGEREVHPAGRRGVAALETSFLFAMVSGFTGYGEDESMLFDWRDGVPAVSGRLPGGGKAVLAASRRGAETGGLGMIVGMVRRRRSEQDFEVTVEAILPTTADLVLCIRLIS